MLFFFLFKVHSKIKLFDSKEASKMFKLSSEMVQIKKIFIQMVKFWFKNNSIFIEKFFKIEKKKRANKKGGAN